MLPGLEEFAHHQLNLSGVELEGATSSPDIEAGAAGTTCNGYLHVCIWALA